MRSIKTGLLLAFFMSVFSLATNAKHYGMAGCGLGSLVFQDQPGMIQVVAATLNATGEQTFGITTGTSNCHEHSGNMAKMYINVNHVAFLKDIAKGQGETIDALAKMYGCDSSELGSTLKFNIERVQPSEQTSPLEIGNNVESILKDKLSNSCKSLS